MKRFYITYFGCNRRQFDCSRIRDYFLANEAVQVFSPSQADVMVVSTCGVSKFHEDESIAKIESLVGKGGNLIVYGCLPAMNADRLGQVFDGRIVPTLDIAKFDDLFPEFGVKMADMPDANTQFEAPPRRMKEHLLRALSEMDLFPLLQAYNIVMIQLEKIRSRLSQLFPGRFADPFLTRVPLFVATPKKKHFSIRITHGCAGHCRFCSIRKAIGRLRSKPLETVLKEVDKGIRIGNYHINLISSDPGAYGLDIGSGLPELVEQVLGRQERIRIELIEGLHPVWLLKEEEALIRLAATGRIRTLMIPIQSGSPRLLQLMNRNPDVNGFERAVSRLRRASGKLRLATQVILGFPTETEEDFLLTMELLRRCAFDEVDLFQYYETPTTDSVDLLPKVPGEITLDRMRRLMLSLPPRTILHTLFGGLQKKEYRKNGKGS